MYKCVCIHIHTYIASWIEKGKEWLNASIGERERERDRFRGLLTRNDASVNQFHDQEARTFDHDEMEQMQVSPHDTEICDEDPFEIGFCGFDSP